jgi:RNase H-fold protein (predicted Holliday junction resolvase)
MDVVNMSLMGIDHGARRVGISLSPSGSSLAFPHDVYGNDRYLVDRIREECREHQIGLIIIGASFDLAGRENVIMPEIIRLKEELANHNIDVEMEPEFYTSAQAARLQGSGERLDASAATLILQSFIDKRLNEHESQNS